MITVIIAGGSGTRLWPLSTSSKPKQLLNLTGDRSLVQDTYDRARLFSDTIYVLPDISHADEVRRQLPELSEENYIVEPGRRGTANCYMAALAHITKRHDHDEPIALISADHHIRDVDGFARSLTIAGDISRHYGRITLVGIEPSYVATGFGYIEKAEPIDEHATAFGVKGFKEKPDFETARQFIESGKFVWNASYFVGSINTFVDRMQKNAPELFANYEKLLAIDDPNSNEYAELYSSFTPDAIEYGLMEKTPDLLVVPAAFDWMDIGSFKDLHEANISDEKGNHIQGANVYTLDVTNAFIRNDEPTKPIAVIGLDNVTVVNTPDGILVSRTDVSQNVGEIAKRLQG